MALYTVTIYDYLKSNGPSSAGEISADWDCSYQDIEDVLAEGVIVRCEPAPDAPVFDNEEANRWYDVGRHPDLVSAEATRRAALAIMAGIVEMELEGNEFKHYTTRGEGTEEIRALEDEVQLLVAEFIKIGHIPGHKFELFPEDPEEVTP